MTTGVQQMMREVEQVRDAFHTAVFGSADLDGALALLAPECALVELPMGSGATGLEDLRRYLAEDVLPHLPADLTFTRTSRTVDRWRVADEVTVAFTHDRALPWLLPGAEPNRRRAQVLTVSVVTVHRARITSHRTLWDLSGLLSQLQLAPAGAGPSRA